MAADFSVRINRKDGVVEIEGSDKEWIAQQLDRLAVVYETLPPNAPQPSHDPVASSGSGSPAGAAKAPPAKPQAPSRSRKAGGRGANRASRNPELEKSLTSELRAALQAFVDERIASWKSQPNQAGIIATFLMDNVNTEGWINEDDLYTVYSVMGWPSPSNFRSQIDNARARNGYFGVWTDGRVQLTHAGEQFGRHGSKSS
jgi:hypothetical protein